MGYLKVGYACCIITEKTTENWIDFFGIYLNY